MWQGDGINEDAAGDDHVCVADVVVVVVVVLAVARLETIADVVVVVV